MGPEEFVIRMIDGNYYAGGTVAEGNLRWTDDVERAARYSKRWTALTICSQGLIFARATILSVAEARSLQKPRGEPTDGMQGQQ